MATLQTRTAAAVTEDVRFESQAPAANRTGCGNWILATGLAMLSFSLAATALGQSSANDVVDGSDHQTAAIDVWIAELGSPSFSVREKASVRLLNAGPEVLAAVAKLSDSASLEVRRRAEQIIERIEGDEFDRVAKSFLLDSDPTKSYELPAWDTYRQLVGSSRTSKLLFLDSVRRQRGLLVEIERQVTHGVSADDLPLHSKLESSATQVAMRVQREQLAMVEPHIGDFVALLLACATIDGNAPVAVSETIDTHLNRYIFSKYLEKQGYGICLQRMLSAWVPKTHDALATRVMHVSLRHGIAEAAVVARKQLKANSDAETRTLALQCLARFGNETDIPQIIPFLADPALVHKLKPDQFLRFSNAAQIDISDAAPPGFEDTSPPTQERFFTVQLNDIALTAVLLLSGENPVEVFPAYYTIPSYGFDTYSLATPQEDQAARSERIERWKRRHLPELPES